MWHSSFSLVAASTSRGKISKKSVVFEKEKDNEKRSVATQTLRAGCSKADPHQTNKQTNKQGRLQYTAQLSAQCNNKYMSLER